MAAILVIDDVDAAKRLLGKALGREEREPDPDAPPAEPSREFVARITGDEAPAIVETAAVVIELPAAHAEVPVALEEVARQAVEEVERRYIERVLARTGQNRTRAAELLGVSRSTLWLKLRKYGLDGGHAA